MGEQGEAGGTVRKRMGWGSKVTAGSVTESGRTNQVASSGRADARSQRWAKSGV